MRPPLPLTWSSTSSGGELRRPRSPRPGLGLLAAVVAVLLAVLSGCSADQRSGASSQAKPAAQADANKAQAPAGAAAVPGGPNAAPGAERQVVQTGEIHLTVPDPVASVAQVLTLVDQLGGRVDAHEETGRDAQSGGSATLTVRVPAAAVEKAVQTLRGFGDVTSFTLQATDVTGAAQDLDARIDSARLSVARMQDLMSRATTTADLISTEQALSERQASLEQLQAQRALLAEQIALSTLRVVLSAPGEAPPVRTRLHSFTDGWTAGLKALGAAARGVLVALGVLGPWLLVAALVAAGALGARRALRRRPGTTPDGPPPDPQGGAPVPTTPPGPVPAAARTAAPAAPPGAAPPPPPDPTAPPLR